MKQNTTEPVRIDSALVNKIRLIAKSNGQTLSGYININLTKVVDRHWQRLFNEDKKQNNPV